MDPRFENRPNRTQVKPTELDRWEGEGGNPPNIASKRRSASSVTGILRQLLVNWHLINAPSNKN